MPASSEDCRSCRAMPTRTSPTILSVFDIVILSQTIQAMRSPRAVLAQLIRIGRHTIVSFPEFWPLAHPPRIALWRRMPQTTALGYSWHATPNIHLCKIADFIELAAEVGARIEQRSP